MIAQLKFLNVKNPSVADNAHLSIVSEKSSITLEYLIDFSLHLHRLNIDGASLSFDIHRGVHCFNPRVELAATDPFRNFFCEQKTMLVFLHCLHQKSSKNFMLQRS